MPHFFNSQNILDFGALTRYHGCLGLGKVLGYQSSLL